MVGLTGGAVSELIDRLLVKNLVTRQESAADPRFQTICLTGEAVALVPKLAALADENDQEFFSVLSHQENQELIRILKKIADKNKINKIPTE